MLEWRPDFEKGKLTLVNFEDRMIGMDVWDFGFTSKSADGESVGCHGEGMKTGSIAILREHGTVDTYSAGTHTRALLKSVPEKQYRGFTVEEDEGYIPTTQILTIGLDTPPSDFPTDWTLFGGQHTIKVLGNVSVASVEKCFVDILPLHYAMKNPRSIGNKKVVEGHGEILFDPCFKGKVFVRGFRLGLGREDVYSGFDYGYNFYDKTLSNQRDRRAIDYSQLMDRILRLWRRGCDDPELAQRMYETLQRDAVSEEAHIMHSLGAEELQQRERPYKIVDNLCDCFEKAHSTEALEDPPYPVARHNAVEKQIGEGFNQKPVECNERLLQFLQMSNQFKSLEHRVQDICSNEAAYSNQNHNSMANHIVSKLSAVAHSVNITIPRLEWIKNSFFQRLNGHYDKDTIFLNDGYCFVMFASL